MLGKIVLIEFPSIGTTPNGQIKMDAPRFPPAQQTQAHQTLRSPEKTRPTPTSGNIVAAISEALASRESSRESPRESPREAPCRPMVRRQPSEAKARGPPPEPPVQKPVMPLVSYKRFLCCGLGMLRTWFYQNWRQNLRFEIYFNWSEIRTEIGTRGEPWH